MDEASGIASKVEKAVEEVLRFLESYLRTHWTLWRHPFRFCDWLLDDLRGSARFVPPLTYLSIGGFAFTLALSAIPYGLWEAFNEGIWAYEEIVKTLQTRWIEALSLTQLLTAAFPALIVVGFLSRAYARILIPAPFSRALIDVSAYAFGYLTFFFFLFYLLGAAGGPLLEHFGVDPVGAWDALFGVGATLLTLAAIPLMALVTPIVLITRLHLAIAVRDPSFPRWKTVLAPVYFAIVLVTLSYAASVPGAFQKLVRQEPPSPRVIARLISIPRLAVGFHDGYVSTAALSYEVVIENQRSTAFVEKVSGWRVTLQLNEGGRAIHSVNIKHGQARRLTGPRVEAAVINPGSADVFAIDEEVALDDRFKDVIHKMLNSKANMNGQFVRLHFAPGWSGDTTAASEQVILTRKGP